MGKGIRNIAFKFKEFALMTKLYVWAHGVFNRLSGGSKYLNDDYES